MVYGPLPLVLQTLFRGLVLLPNGTRVVANTSAGTGSQRSPGVLATSSMEDNTMQILKEKNMISERYERA